MVRAPARPHLLEYRREIRRSTVAQRCITIVFKTAITPRMIVELARRIELDMARKPAARQRYAS
jgi:hypothetical protein